MKLQIKHKWPRDGGDHKINLSKLKKHIIIYFYSKNIVIHNKKDRVV